MTSSFDLVSTSSHLVVLTSSRPLYGDEETKTSYTNLPTPNREEF